jgi:hypothetical protein
MRRSLIVFLAVALAAATLAAQSRPPAKKPPAKPKAPPAPALMTEPADMTCPQVLGMGITTRRQFCDVLTGRNPADGILVRLPVHKGPATLTFDLHNRHTYSEQLVRARKAYTAYTATIGVLTMDGKLLARGVVQNEFRTTRDLVDRVGGGAGPGGVKAVAPTGAEKITIEIAAEIDAVSILGEKLSVVGLNGPEFFTAPGRPIALISNAMVEYRPAPPKAPAKKPPVKRR